MTSDETIIVACASDAAYAMPLATMLRSLSTNLSENYRVDAFVLDDGVSPEDKVKVATSLPERITVYWESARALPAGLPVWGRMSSTTYQKLAMGSWLPSSCDRVIWLDCDLLILADVSQLWTNAPVPKILLAAQDERVPFVSSTFGIAAHLELGIGAENKYFNAGVMVIDLERWRSADIGTRSLNYLTQFARSVYFWDQEALNAVLFDSWDELDSRWNRHPTLRDLSPTIGTTTVPEPSIVHFSGSRKPWTSYSHGRYHSLFYSYLDQTVWAGHRPRCNWRTKFMERYETSALRRRLHPVEEWATRFQRYATRQYC
jgi:lipopolysaccharide biosynthesis glycosyltransferase